MLGHRTSLAVAGLILSRWLARRRLAGLRSLRQVVAGIDYIAIGMVLFGLAVLTSMVKGGMLSSRTTYHKPEVPGVPEY